MREERSEHAAKFRETTFDRYAGRVRVRIGKRYDYVDVNRQRQGQGPETRRTAGKKPCNAKEPIGTTGLEHLGVLRRGLRQGDLTAWR